MNSNSIGSICSVTFHELQISLFHLHEPHCVHMSFDPVIYWQRQTNLDFLPDMHICVPMWCFLYLVSYLLTSAFDLYYSSSLSWMKQIEFWMLVSRRSWNSSFSAYQKIGKTYSFLQQLQLICKSCVTDTKISCIALRLMKAWKQLKLLSSRLYSFPKRLRRFIWCIFCLKWKIWTFALPLSLSPPAGIISNRNVIWMFYSFFFYFLFNYHCLLFDFNF